VRNIGSQNKATGALKVELIGTNGTNANSFILSAVSLSSIASNATRNFTVRPAEGLPVRINAGTGAIMPYTATVRVRGNNGILAEFNVSFTVNRLAGAAVDNAPEMMEVKADEITVNQVQVSGLNPGGQSVEYAITASTSMTLPTGLVWRSIPEGETTITFTGLAHTTTYHVWARTAQTNNYNAGTAVRSAAITTSEAS